jgi:RHS repeat-associated protein
MNALVLTYHLVKTTFSSRFTFSAKEKDSETGFSYFGSRYYSSDLSIWLSVDPQASKYPSLSPYAYCANNPIKLVDPNGEEVIVSGSGSEDVKTQINNMTSKNFKVSLDSDGKMTYSGKAKTKTDKFVKNAIDRSDVTINIVAENDKKSFTSKTDGKKYDYKNEDDGIICTGAYGGSEYVNGHAISYQYVDPNRSAKLDDAVGDNVSGGYMLHEFAEGYYSADIALRNKGGDPISLRNNYGVAHNRANAISGGDWMYSTEYMTLPNGSKMQTYSGLRRSPTY